MPQSKNILRDLDDEDDLDQHEQSIHSKKYMEVVEVRASPKVTVSDHLVRKYDTAQRELVTQAVDFGLRSLAERVEKKVIDASPRYQRRLRWTPEQQSRLIESFLMNVPIPPIFLSEDEYGQFSVIDGQQRLRAIHGFMNEEYPLVGLEFFDELNGRRFSELPIVLQNVLEVRAFLRGIIVHKQSDPEIKFEIFQRINMGGSYLNAQELRNSIYRGSLNDMILSLSENEQFRRMLRIRNPETSSIVQYMRDCELIVRFFALKDAWQDYHGNMKDTLNAFMEAHRNETPDDLIRLKEDFRRTLNRVHSIFGEIAFRRWNPRSHQWSRSVVASVYDAEMIAAYQLTSPAIRMLESKQETDSVAFSSEVQGRLVELGEEFQTAISGQTNDPKKLSARIREVSTLLENVARD